MRKTYHIDGEGLVAQLKAAEPLQVQELNEFEKKFIFCMEMTDTSQLEQLSITVSDVLEMIEEVESLTERFVLEKGEHMQDILQKIPAKERRIFL